MSLPELRAPRGHGRVEGMITSVRVRVPGKINLYLAVGPRGADGYHPLATVFQAVDVYEDVTATASEELRLTLTGGGTGLPVDERNLAIRAARLLAREAGVEPRADLTIHKRIPVAGGMAGGSADAAGTLLALDRLWRLGLDAAELLRLGALLGADVPFCLMGGTAMGLGRGDVLTPMLARGSFTWLFLTQAAGLSTPAVFAEWDRRHEPDPASAGAPARKPSRARPPAVGKRFARALAQGDTGYVARNARNDLEACAAALHPGTRRALEACAAVGLAALVSGSGPTVAALVPAEESAEALQAYFEENAVAESCFVARGPVPGAHVIDES